MSMPVAVDVFHFQLAHLGPAHTGRVSRHQHGLRKEIAGRVSCACQVLQIGSGSNWTFEPGVGPDSTKASPYSLRRTRRVFVRSHALDLSRAHFFLPVRVLSRVFRGSLSRDCGRFFKETSSCFTERVCHWRRRRLLAPSCAHCSGKSGWCIPKRV